MMMGAAKKDKKKTCISLQRFEGGLPGEGVIRLTEMKHESLKAPEQEARNKKRRKLVGSGVG